MGIDTALTDEIVRRILQVATPDRVILFGSAATGQMTRDSDIDLLVVEPAPANRTVESVRIRRALGELGYPVDVIVISTGRFERMFTLSGHALPGAKWLLVQGLFAVTAGSGA